VSLVHNLQTIYTKVEGTWKSENEINNCDPLTTLISTLVFSTVMVTDQTSEGIETVPKKIPTVLTVPTLFFLAEMIPCHEKRRVHN
jgi:hypothetical protein